MILLHMQNKRIQRPLFQKLFLAKKGSISEKKVPMSDANCTNYQLWKHKVKTYKQILWQMLTSSAFNLLIL